jgi:DNA-directed RNA polymerase specialized sigma24 family protein
MTFRFDGFPSREEKSMRSPESTDEPDSILGRVRAFTRRLRRDQGFGPEDRDDLAQELLLRFHLRDAFVGLVLPVAAVRRILRQGLSNHFRSRSRKKRKPTGSVVLLSALEEFAGWHPTVSAVGDPATRDFDLDWDTILATFDRREIHLVDRWRDHDWRRPRGLSNDERKQFNRLRRKLAERLIELGYLPGGDADA